MLLKQILVYSILIYFSTACSQKVDNEESIEISKNNIWELVQQKVTWFKKNNYPKIDLESIPDSFLNFYHLFISDSLYQINHIHFEKLIGVIGECDTTIIFNSKNWQYTNWNFVEFFPIDNNTNDIDGWNNTFYSNKSIFYYEFELKEAGVIYQVGFERINEKWLLTLYYVNAC
jgi:competence protein ComGF